MTTPAYFLRTGNEDKYACGAMLQEPLEQSWFSSDVMKPEAFERKAHTLEVLDNKEHDVPSDNLHDVAWAHPAVLALSERSWPLLPSLVESGCRIAENVKVSGAKQYKLVFPAKVLDILDHQSSEVHLNMGGVSHVRNRTLYDDPIDLPLLFQVLYRGPTESRPSIDIFASQEFVDAYNELGLTGADFYPVSRTKRAA
jgi:hypothetical protein